MPGLSSFDAIMGERVRATMVEMMTAPVRVKANSRKSAPRLYAKTVRSMVFG